MKHTLIAIAILVTVSLASFTAGACVSTETPVVVDEPVTSVYTLPVIEHELIIETAFDEAIAYERARADQAAIDNIVANVTDYIIESAEAAATMAVHIAIEEVYKDQARANAVYGIAHDDIGRELERLPSLSALN